MYRVARLFLLLFINVLDIDSKICQTMQLMNSVENLNKLRNCTEIAGNLKIFLMEKVRSEAEFDGLVFPELTHITGYLLLYKVAKLTTVAKLFPNLRVIRGTERLEEYSFIVYDMPDLTEIGTNNLMFIAKGWVIVDKCPKLCYANTINWKKIGAGRLTYPSLSRVDNICEPCPVECDGFCWNSHTCQNIDTDNCDKECLGCRVYNSAKHCYACKNFEDEAICVEKCPNTKYTLRSHYKCVTENECIGRLNGTLNGTWWTHTYEEDGETRKECVSECPRYYEVHTDEVSKKTTCQKCDDHCTKICTPEPIENMDRLERLNGDSRENIPICTQDDQSLTTASILTSTSALILTSASILTLTLFC